VKGSPEKAMPFQKLVQIACYSGSGAVIVGKGYSQYGIEVLDFDKGIGNSGTSYSFTSQLSEVDVDLETGFVKCTDMVIAHDCGRPLNPINVEAQNEGAAVQGLGQTLYEEFKMDKGRTLNPNLVDYKMPLSLDAPKIKVIDIITDDPNGPYGAKEASEGAIVSSPPSVVSAIHDATGIWFKEQPITPEKIVMALREKKK
jgi:4-hydroxybenzoyl-CoA reductase subunit alpha